LAKGLSSVKTLTAKQIADKWNLPLSVVAKKIEAGIKVEKEHTKSTREANEIARDHLGERPDYYEKLHKMEKQPIVKEETMTSGIGGLGFRTGTPAVDDDNGYVSTNALAYDPFNGARLDFMTKIHNKLHNKLGFNSYSPKDTAHSNKELVEKKLNELGEYDNKGGTIGAEGLTDAPPKKDVKEGWASIGHPYDRFGDVNRKAKFYGKKPKATTTKSDEKDDTYKDSKQGGSDVKFAKTVKEAQIDELVATAVPPSIQPTQTQIQRQAPQQARGIQAGQTKINVRSIAPRTTTSGTGSARLSQGGTTGGYNTMKPTTTDVKRNISNRFNPNFSQQATGSMKASSVKTGASFSQGGSQVAQKMAKSSPSQVISKMSDAGRQAASVASKAAPTAAKVAGTIARVAAGPAATAAAAVMSPTPAGEKKSEFQRQADVAKGVSYKAQGRSISDYEKQVLTPKASETPKAPNPKVDAPTPPSRPEYFSRGQAFGAARGEAGGGQGKFSYDNKEYQTNVSGEPYKPSTQLKQTSVKEETKMDNKERINEALDCILENNLSEMKDNLLIALQEKAMEKLEERKKEIAANYFAE
jgi:hypothetical protein